MSPKARQLAILRTYLATSSLKEAAFAEGIILQAAKNQLRDLYARLNVHGAIEASIALGWTKLPEPDVRCAMMSGRCLLPPGHTCGHHIAVLA